MLVRVQQPDVAYESDILKSGSAHCVERYSVMLKVSFPARLLEWHFQGQAESPGQCIGESEIKSMHACLRVEFRGRWERKLFAPLEISERMKKTIRNRQQRFVWC